MKRASWWKLQHRQPIVIYQGHSLSLPPSHLLPGLPNGQKVNEPNDAVYAENLGRVQSRERWRLGLEFNGPRRTLSTSVSPSGP